MPTRLITLVIKTFPNAFDKKYVTIEANFWMVGLVNKALTKQDHQKTVDPHDIREF